MDKTDWKAGDRAMLWAPNAVGKHKHLHGTLCTIISLEAQESGKYTVESDECPYPDLDSEWRGWAVRPENLRPINHGNFDQSMRDLF